MSSTLYSIASTIIFFLLIFDPSCPGNMLVHGTSLHVWRGKIVYYGGDREAGLKETNESCTRMGGHLPSIHSHADAIELINLIGQDARLWLGAKMQDMSSPQQPLGQYEWDDGTPFDYQGWVKTYPSCKKSCCGVGYTTVYEDGMVDKECNIARRMLCIMPVLTNNTAREWFERELSSFNFSSFNESMAKDFEQQLAIDILNETMTALQQSTKYLYTKIFHLETTFEDEISKINSSIVKNGNDLSGLLLNYKDSITMQTHQASRVGNENQSQLEWLNHKINFCFVLLTLLIVTSFLVVLYRFNLTSCTKLREPHHYARFGVHRSSPNGQQDSTVRLDSVYSEPNDNATPSCSTVSNDAFNA